jgi:hypothetical protein
MGIANDALYQFCPAGGHFALFLSFNFQYFIYIGKVLAIALNMLSPELVILGGPLTQDGGIILEAVQRQVRLRALQHILTRTNIVYDDQGEWAGSRGAALLVLDRLFSSEAHVTRLLEVNGS